MARLPRLYAPDAVHYLMQRVAAGRALCTDADDTGAFLRLLGDACRRHGFALHAYALTSSEVHLLGTPATADAPADVLQAIGRAYVPRINRKTGRGGALWERRYRSTLVDPALLVPVMQVIESCAGEGGGPTASSHAHHVGLRQDASITDHAGYWALSDTPFERQALYRAAAPPDGAFAARVRLAVERGWAFGSPDFVATLQQTANRRAGPLPRGRPRKSPAIGMAPINQSERERV